jgi:hypothetical protein
MGTFFWDHAEASEQPSPVAIVLAAWELLHSPRSGFARQQDSTRINHS